jgi:hypothetical protein
LTILLSNIFGALSDILCGVAGLAKTKKRILMTSISASILGIASTLLVGGYTAVVTLTLSCVTLLINYKHEMGKAFTIVYLAALVTISILFSTNGIIDVLPVLANGEYMTIVACTKNVKYTRIAVFVNTVLWCIFNLYFKIYASAVIEVISMVLIINKIRKEIK